LTFTTASSVLGAAETKSTATWFAPLRRVEAGVLDVEYAEAGPAGGRAVLLLHGWPYDIHTYVDIAPLLAARGYRAIVPHVWGYGVTRFLSNDAPRRGYLIGNQAVARVPLAPSAELQWWYQYYFATDRGGRDTRNIAGSSRSLSGVSLRRAGNSTTPHLSAAPRPLTIRITSTSSSIIVAGGSDSLKASPGTTRMEARLAAGPPINIPAITLEGEANRAPHPEPSVYANRFTCKYEHRTVPGGIGHNLPQEAPEAFAQAIFDADAL
jgi:pimeloyl-ACP methyl ester carboxylesterase